MNPQGFHVLYLAMEVIVFLLGALALLPAAWHRLDTRRRVLSLVLLASMFAVIAFGVGPGFHDAMNVQGGLMMTCCALLFWAVAFCEWSIPKSVISDPGAQHERRVLGGLSGVACILMGAGNFFGDAPHAKWISLLLMLIGAAVFSSLQIPRLRAAMLQLLRL